MIAPRGATPCNLMLAEVGRAHVAKAIPIIFQPAEVFKVWGAVSSYLRGALLSGVNVSIFRKTISFSCSKRKTFKKIPAGFHREAQVFDLRVPLFGVSSSFATTYSLDSPLVEDPSLTFTQMPTKVISEAAKVPVAVVNAVLHDIMRFVGEALFQGRLLELEFPGVAHVRAKRDRVMAVFDDDFTAELLNIDTRKWPAVYAREARELLLKRKNNNNRPGSSSSSARPSSARPNSARSTTSKAFQPAQPFVNAPAPIGRTFDEMQETRENEMDRKKRRSQSLQKQQQQRPSSSSSTSARRPQQQQQQEQGPEFNNNLAVVYDETVPASSLSPVKINGKSTSRAREESVYDMVMPSANSGTGIPQPAAAAANNNNNINNNNQHQRVVQTADMNGQTVIMNNNNNNQDSHYYEAAATAPPPVSSSSERPRTGRRLASRSIHTNSHIHIFGFGQEEQYNNNNNQYQDPYYDGNNNNYENNLDKHANPPHLMTGKRRFAERYQNQPTTVLGGATDPINHRIQRDMPAAGGDEQNSGQKQQQAELGQP